MSEKEYKQEFDYIDNWYKKLEGTEYIRDYAETRYFDTTSVHILVSKEIMKKVHPKEEQYFIRGVVMDGDKKVITITYIL